MLKSGPSARHGKGRPRTRITEKVVAGIATLSLVASMCPGVAALAFANGQIADGSVDGELGGGTESLQDQVALVAQALTAQDDSTKVNELTPNDHRLSTGVYAVKGRRRRPRPRPRPATSRRSPWAASRWPRCSARARWRCPSRGGAAKGAS